MSTAETISAAERAVLERVRTQLARGDGGTQVIGIRTAGTPVWHSNPAPRVDNRRLRIVACPSVLAVLDALVDVTGDVVTVLLTDQPDDELGDAVLARLHRNKLYDADRYTLLGDVLGTQSLDPRIRADAWLVDALIELTAANALPSTVGATLSRERALSLIAGARLGIDPEQLDLPGLVAAFDDSTVRAHWRDLAQDERDGLLTYLEKRQGASAGVIAVLARNRDDVLAELLVVQAITGAPDTDTQAATALGAFTQSRFPERRPSRIDLAAAGDAAAVHARDQHSERISQQIRRADGFIDELDAAGVAVFSDVLPLGFTERLAQAATTLDDVSIAEVESHQQAEAQPHRVARLVAAVRLRRWLDTTPSAQYTTAAQGLTDHARSLAWVDRALTQVRAGDSDPRVGQTLNRIGTQAGALRATFDTDFAARLAVARDTPTETLGVETVLPKIVAPLAEHREVLLVVIDGMSGAVASELAEQLTGHHGGWTEAVRAADGGREAVLAALPTETKYSRSSLFRAALRSGDQDGERAAFAAHRFRPGGGVLVHKAGVAGRDGTDLGPELEAALRQYEGPRVVAVVLNAVDDSLAKGRQSTDPGWPITDVTGLPQLLERAATTGRIVVLTSDHGHILEHGSELRTCTGGGARWRPDGAPVQPDEVLVTGPRVLTPSGRAILAASEQVRYGARGHGYHGGATLAEVAIPLIVLLPPGLDVPTGWHRQTPSAPGWWTGTVTPPVAAPSTPPQARRVPSKKPVAQAGDGLFDVPVPELASPRRVSSRGAQLVASAAFKAVHQEMPANRVPDPAVFAAVVDALSTAGGRLPISAVLAAAGFGGRNPRALVSALRRVLNLDSYEVLSLVDNGRTVLLDLELLDEQFPPKRS